jgi:hypothetical protein
MYLVLITVNTITGGNTTKTVMQDTRLEENMSKEHYTYTQRFILGHQVKVRAHCVAAGLGTALQAERLQVRFPRVSKEFFIDIILPTALWPWGQLNR